MGYDYRLRPGPFDPPPPSGGVVQIIRKIGPFHIAFDAAGITGNGALLTAGLAAGDIVQFVWMQPTVEWDFGEPATFVIQVAPNADPGNTYTAAIYVSGPGDVISVQGDAAVNVEATSGDGSAVPFRSVIRLTEASRLVASTGIAATAGEGDVYALIAVSA